MNTFKKIIGLACFSVFSCSYALTPKTDFGQIYFLGDSLTDSGFIDNYAQGLKKHGAFTDIIERDVPFSNPKRIAVNWTWANWLVSMYNTEYPGSNFESIPNNIHNSVSENCVTNTLKGNNFAQGGAVIDGTGLGMGNCFQPLSLSQQIQHFVQTKKSAIVASGKPPLIIIWAGSNNFIRALGIPGVTGPINQNPTIPYEHFANSFVSNVKNLQKELGTKAYIMIIGLPNIADTPLYHKTAIQYPTFNEAVTTDIQKFNTTIKDGLAGKDLLYFDTFELMNDTIQKVEHSPNQMYNYAIHVNGVTYQVALSHPYEAACIAPITTALVCNSTIAKTKKSYIFSDIVHPMSQMHEILAAKMLEALNAWHPTD